MQTRVCISIIILICLVVLYFYPTSPIYAREISGEIKPDRRVTFAEKSVANDGEKKKLKPPGPN